MVSCLQPALQVTGHYSVLRQILIQVLRHVWYGMVWYGVVWWTPTCSMQATIQFSGRYGIVLYSGHMSAECIKLHTNKFSDWYGMAQSKQLVVRPKKSDLQTIGDIVLQHCRIALYTSQLGKALNHSSKATSCVT